MAKDVGHCGSLAWFELEHELDEVLEFLGEELLASLLVLAVSSPEDVSTFAGKASVEGV